MELFKRKSGEPYGHSKMKAPGSKHFYRPVWSGGKWNEFVESRKVGRLLQVCCGASRVGRVRVDLDPDAPSLNCRADMLRLPFKDKSFDSVACDPPYELPHQIRVHLQRELARIARKRIIFKAPWILRARGWVLGETVLLGSHTCQNTSVLSVLERKLQTKNLF